MYCALDYNITERDFWEMTLGEAERAIESKAKMQKIEMQQRASFDYLLADLIGRSIARIYSSANTMPEISSVYPTLFDNKEIQESAQKKKDEVSALRFKQFAQFHNDKYKKEAAKN